MNLIPTKEIDYLDEDPPIRGQNYACISFLSPEDVLKEKESYYIEAFLKKYVERNLELMNGLEVLFSDKKDELRSIKEQYDIYFNSEKIDKEYKSFKKINENEISEKYSKENNFKTNIRGIKIRGAYDTLREAEIRSEVLKKKESSKHNIYIAQVGCWCPWDPNPDEILDPIHSESELNTLMSEYNKNKEMNDEYYNSRKHDLIKRTEEENEKRKQQNESSSSELLMEKLQVKDAWSESKEL